MKLKTCVCLACVAASFAAEAVEIIKPAVGDVPTYSAADDEWRGTMVFNDAPHPPETFRPLGHDFFEHEYGLALDFSIRDVLQKTEAHVIGNGSIRGGALEIRPSADGRPFGLYWGTTAQTPKTPGICLGEYNGEVLSQNEFVAFDLEQSATMSVWRFVIYDVNAQPMGPGETWTLAGAGRRRFVRRAFGNVGPFNGLRRGFGLECLTPGSGVRVHKIAIRPRGGDVYFRKEFTLAFKPDVAKLSFMIDSLDDYDLFVNGVNLAKPTGNMMSIQPRDLEIARHLKAGVNTLAIRHRYTILFKYPCGPEPSARLLLDLFAYDRLGRSAFLGSGTDWKTTFTPPPPRPRLDS